MSKCDICKINHADYSAILDGKYYSRVCRSCKTAHNQVSSGHARWSRGIDLEDNEHEIQQPYNADGTINVRFAKLYPEQAKALFTDEEIRKASL